MSSSTTSHAKWQNRSKDCEHYKNIVLTKELPLFPAKIVSAEDFNFQSHVLEDCFAFPVIVNGYSDNFGIKVPASDFTIHEVAELIGKDTSIRLMDVAEQREINGFTISQYADYLQKNQEINEAIDAGNAKPSQALKILNLISLEFSDTPLSKIVLAPKFVPQLDWEDLTLTDEQLEERQQKQHMDSEKTQEDEPDYTKGKKISSKVQKYCLIGMGGSYTDFHLDFGGTSVWYHIVRGGKRFYLIPPTQENLDIYEKWNRSSDQQASFLGDLVEKGQCFYIDLHPQQTLLLPSAWIHAVYTPVDSLVFGGNFIHLPGIRRQLACYEIENHLKINKIYRYPSFIPLQWKVLCLVLRTLVGGKNEGVNTSESVVIPGTEEWSTDRLSTWRYLLTQSSIIKQVSSLADKLLVMLNENSSDLSYQNEIIDVCQSMTKLSPSKVFEQLKLALYRLLNSPDMKTKDSNAVPEIVNYDKCMSSTIVFKMHTKSKVSSDKISLTTTSVAASVGNNNKNSDHPKKSRNDLEGSALDDDNNNGRSRGKRIRKEMLDELVDENDGLDEDDFEMDADEDEEDHAEEVKFQKIRFNAKGDVESDEDGLIDDDDDAMGKKKSRAKAKASSNAGKKASSTTSTAQAKAATGNTTGGINKKKSTKPPPSLRDKLKATLAKKW